MLASGSRDKTIKIFNRDDDFKELYTLHGHTMSNPN